MKMKPQPERFEQQQPVGVGDQICSARPTIDGMVLALDAVLRAQLWPAREDET